jgi:putative SOS response-associated peptidase YedK
MCGRFGLRVSPKLVAKQFRLVEEPTLLLRYNIAPTQLVAAVRKKPDAAERKLDILRWGLVPFWAKDLKIGNRLINARAETVSKKPAFRASFRQKRCLIPADGFYEWKHLEKRKQPYFVRLRDRGLLAFAALWDHWKGPEHEIIESCTIITTDSNELIRPIHERMPVILGPSDYDLWLDLSVREKDLQQLLRPFPSDQMETILLV